MAQQPLVGQGLHIIETLRSYTDTPHLLGLHALSYKPDTVTRPDNTHRSYEKDIRALAGFETPIPANELPYAQAFICTYSCLYIHYCENILGNIFRS